jgi:purine-binding chemotaxis protein CheW
MEVQEILIIKNGAENYGISTQDINQISRVPILMPLPLRPAGVRGLCAVAGNIVSLLDLNLLIGMSEVDYAADKTRLLSLNDAYASNALLVSEVYNTVEIDQSNIEYIEQEDDPVIAIYKYENMLVQVISLERLIAKVNSVKIDAKEIKNGKVKQEVEKEIESYRFLIFSMYREKFALNIDYLQEIILADQEITEIVGSSDEVMGLITLRDELLMVIDLRKYYGFNAHKSEKNRILVASHNGKKVGLLIDEIIDIKNFLITDIEYMNETLDQAKITGVIHDSNSLISFFDGTVLDTIFTENDAFIDHEVKETLSNSDDVAMEVIVFKLNGKEYAFDVANVDEIIDIVPSTEVAFSDENIDGIINIRGQVVSIVSLYKKLGLDARTNEDSKIIVCNINNVRIGFTVDSVSDIINVKSSDIREEDGEFFTNILYLDDGSRLVLVMDVNTLLEEKEI